MKKDSVLVIDDDRHVRDLVSAILGGAGFDVLMALDGSSGIDLARTALPAAIILDMGWTASAR